MESNILNFHDLVLFMSTLAAVYLALMVALESKGSSRLYLPVFLVCTAIETLYIMSFYSLFGATYIASQMPFFYFFLIAAFYIKGQTLFFYVSFRVIKNYHITNKSIFHITPLFVYIFTIIVSYDSNSTLYRNFYTWQGNFVNPSTYHLTLIIYGFASLYIFIKHGLKVSEKKQYVFKETTTNQLLMIVGGYLFIWFVGFSAHTAYHLTENMNIASSIGKTAIYLNFIMLIALFTFFWRARLDSNMYEHSHIEDEPQFRQDMDFNVRKISQLIENKKPYLQPNMTLDRMAHELNTTPRALSVVLNEFYGISFYQYLNQNRIEEAKKLLASQGKRTQISSIYSLAGFTSRTTFNVKFKEFVGQTPSEYRRAVINNIR